MNKNNFIFALVFILIFVSGLPFKILAQEVTLEAPADSSSAPEPAGEDIGNPPTEEISTPLPVESQPDSSAEVQLEMTITTPPTGVTTGEVLGDNTTLSATAGAGLEQASTETATFDSSTDESTSTGTGSGASSGSTPESIDDSSSAMPVPGIKVSWEMAGRYEDLTGQDDLIDVGAQFNAPGVWGATSTYSVCAIATDSGQTIDSGIYANVYYPNKKAFGGFPETQPDLPGGGSSEKPDFGASGCGAKIGDKVQMNQLNQIEGYRLFCETIKNNNNSLPTFSILPGSSDTYTYNEICDPDGELIKETANVYCTDQVLNFQDPAGDYKVKIITLDSAGAESNFSENYFTYLSLTAYEVDFSNVSYGGVTENVEQFLDGDTDFGTESLPTVRNIGNTRLNMGIRQNDMMLGISGGVWNVSYKTRVGKGEGDWTSYVPTEHVYLEDILDLGSLAEMDFAILVKNFPSEAQDFAGALTLDAQPALFRACVADGTARDSSTSSE
ncbi:MAG: hypothetical protein A2445_03615 [Candidatus Jacksonbacteria bacterium RIFOXYC2_FULL_44_29]|nr:MAG: hypothetical protein UV19_C0011G0007 [Parcubacteria group bacterium GW2011_GWA2_42_28]KKT53815.1 MAG: hypothetical protein UW45_C0025G0007 [Parcubacteria group bacterium GW2011_GWC2_44_22]OGY76740.1 MAG: hypothetical protein A2240_00800 [Candidatus Jacksonbacteria bacterium RIFOXYA2_FULL_43_12]OGY77316.1 MAG: hypothetical protein A2295_03710 [Candidatus Jacksonbacteria bacterium RIFOXYB2_FULL_44_15]OGY79070.1 MAG: hypothetical protein A2550_04605 [Candidatus Jacksonbacteria bacterium RI